MNNEEFDKEVLESTIPTVVDFMATWCAPCRHLAPILEKLEADNKGKFNLVKVDIDQSPELASRFKIRGVPTVILFKDGDMVDHVVGNNSRIKTMIETNI